MGSHNERAALAWTARRFSRLGADITIRGNSALVRGKDRYGHFVPTPQPARDFDPVAVAFHAQAAKAMREVLYAGAERNLQRL